MLQRFFDIIRGIGDGSDFETYYMRIQSDGFPGTPTADEAKKDYRARAWAVWKFLG